VARNQELTAGVYKRGSEIAIALRPTRLSKLLPKLGTVIAPIFLLACGNTVAAQRELTWNEQASISTNDHVRVARIMHFSVSRPWGEKGGMIVSSSSIVRIVGPTGYELDLDVGPLIPILIEKETSSGDYVVVAGTNRCSVWLRNAEPQPPYWTFRFRNNVWYRIDLPANLIGRKANLLIDFRDSDSLKISDSEVVSRKEAQSRDKPASSLREVLPYDPVKRNCGHSTDNDKELDLTGFKKL
jgi:hypothetical protein